MTENESTEAIFKFDEITKKYEKKKKPVIPVENSAITGIVTNSNDIPESNSLKTLQKDSEGSCQSGISPVTGPNISAILS